MTAWAPLSYVPSEVTGGVLRPGGLVLTKIVADRCGFSQGTDILDIGCGLGATLRYLTDRRGCRAYGLDISAQMLSKCRGLPVLQADATALPFYDACLDGIFCECVLSLLPRKAEALQEFRRVLRPGGRLALTDIYRRGLSPETGWVGTPATCLSGAMSCDALIAQLDESGFDVMLWEDHSRYLAEFSAQMVWVLGSRDLWLQRLFPGACSAENRRMLQHVRFGYGLWIVRSKG